MQISPNLEIIETALWLRKEKALVINDLHLGYEESLQKKGVLIPKFQFKEILSSLERILSKVTAVSGATVSFSIFNLVAGETRYCLPPVAIT